MSSCGFLTTQDTGNVLQRAASIRTLAWPEIKTLVVVMTRAVTTAVFTLIPTREEEGTSH